jgi:hypothetical protein
MAEMEKHKTQGLIRGERGEFEQWVIRKTIKL